MKYNSSLRHNLKKITEDQLPSGESAKAKTLREDVWTDYYDKIEDIAVDPITITDKYKTRKELEAALKKAYGWNVNKPAIREALDRWFETFGTYEEESAICKVKGKMISESKKTNAHELEFENFPAGLRLVEYSDSIGVNSYSGGNGYGSSYNQSWVNPDYPNMEWDEIKKIIENIIRDLVPAADKFDREIERVMNKYGFKKK